jgi:hypothetical protein
MILNRRCRAYPDVAAERVGSLLTSWSFDRATHNTWKVDNCLIQVFHLTKRVQHSALSGLLIRPRVSAWWCPGPDPYLLTA